MLTAILGILSPIFGQVAKNLFPDPADELKRMQMQADLQRELIARANEIELAAASIVKAEAESDNWITSSWRPILMLSFGALIVARWLGWTAPGITEAELLKLWDIIQLGLGGYVIGRSVEKIAPSIAEVLRK
jgi:hypothetical protein